MLAFARLQTIVCTSRREEARVFYGDVLGLPLIGESHGALVYQVGAGELRVSPVPSTRPSEHTVIGFAVDDLNAQIGELAAKGVTFERFANFRHDARGVVTTPEGAQVAWLRDPDGNLISVVQYAS